MQDDRKVQHRILQCWVLLRKNGRLGKWRDRRTIFFEDGKLDLLRFLTVKKVCCKRGGGLKYMGECTKRITKITKREVISGPCKLLNIT